MSERDSVRERERELMCVCVRACVACARACVRACVCEVLEVMKKMLNEVQCRRLYLYGVAIRTAALRIFVFCSLFAQPLCVLL